MNTAEELIGLFGMLISIIISVFIYDYVSRYEMTNVKSIQTAKSFELEGINYTCSPTKIDAEKLKKKYELEIGNLKKKINKLEK